LQYKIVTPFLFVIRNCLIRKYFCCGSGK
jgi:hypothetical protein